MKAWLPSTLLLLAGAAVASADFIRQIQTVSGLQLIYDTTITGDTGQILSKPIPSSSAVFQLYTSVTSGTTTTLVKLDEKTVGTYLPVVTTQMLSADPHVPARTRADQPYGVTITVSGMQPSTAAVPDSAKQVQMRRSYKLYDAATHAPTATTAAGDYADSFQFQSNGTFTSSSVIQRLPVTLPTQAMGEEFLTVYTYPDPAATQGQLSKATVQIWPVATCAITGIDPAVNYLATPTTGAVQLTNLYPKSTTYIQIYKGQPALGSVGAVLPSTVLAYDSAEPQNAQLSISDLNSAVSDDGTYTLEVLSITPFNSGAPERLAYTTFNLHRTIKLHGVVGGME